MAKVVSTSMAVVSNVIDLIVFLSQPVPINGPMRMLQGLSADEKD